MATALLFVGIVSGTVLRHIAQMVPIMVGLEVAATFVMAGCSLLGVVRSIQVERRARPVARVLVFLAFAVMQALAMWVSFLRPIANRRAIHVDRTVAV